LNLDKVVIIILEEYASTSGTSTEIKNLLKKDLFKKLLSIKGSPYKLAKSVSLGFGLALLPLPGLNLPLGIVLAKFFRLNIVATSIPAILLAYVSPFLYVLNYKTGAIFLNTGPAPAQQYDIVYDLSFFDQVLDFFANVGSAYLLGSAINATLIAVVSYFVFLFLFLKIEKSRKKAR
jgi:uncharacterized protein (DUF2062 family)